MLKDFNWQASGDASALEGRLVSELLALEKANVHDIIQSEERANAVMSQIEKALNELTHIDDWLDQYTRLLQGMGQDVHQIETQNKGMQVISFNQRALASEINSLMQSLRVPAYILEVLKNEPLSQPEGVVECEKAIQKVMDIIRMDFAETRSLAAVGERIEVLQSHANAFGERLFNHLTEFLAEQASYYLNDKQRASQRGALKLYAHESLESKLFKYKSLITWLKDTNSRMHYELQLAYANEMGSAYSREIHDYLEVLKNNFECRKFVEDFLFTVHVNTVSSVASNAIKAMKPYDMGGIKQKIEAMRKKKDEDTPLKHGASGISLSEEEKMNPDEALGHALLKLSAIMVREQNLIMNLFGLVRKVDDGPTSIIAAVDLEDELEEETSESKLAEWQNGLNIHHELFKDAKTEKRLFELSSTVFDIDNLRQTLLDLVDFGLKQDQTYAVGMLVHIEYYLKDFQNTCHTFIVNLMDVLHKRVSQIFDKFIVFSTHT